MGLAAYKAPRFPTPSAFTPGGPSMAGGHRQGVTHSLATRRAQGGLLFSVSEQMGKFPISETNDIEVTTLFCISHLSCHELSQHWVYGDKVRQEPRSAWAVVSSEGLVGWEGEAISFQVQRVAVGRQPLTLAAGSCHDRAADPRTRDHPGRSHSPKLLLRLAYHCFCALCWSGARQQVPPCEGRNHTRVGTPAGPGVRRRVRGQGRLPP